MNITQFKTKIYKVITKRLFFTYNRHLSNWSDYDNSIFAHLSPQFWLSLPQEVSSGRAKIQLLLLPIKEHNKLCWLESHDFQANIARPMWWHSSFQTITCSLIQIPHNKSPTLYSRAISFLFYMELDHKLVKKNRLFIKLQNRWKRHEYIPHTNIFNI